MRKIIHLMIVLLLLLNLNLLKALPEYQVGTDIINRDYFANITPNLFKKGSDSDRIEEAIKAALRSGINSVEIPRFNIIKNKAEWLIDRAIVLPSDFSLILNNCLVRLAPGTRDNIITNRGARTNPVSPDNNIRIIGIGNAVLSGGLEAHFDPPGDLSGYLTIGILLFNTKYFSIEGIKMEETQAWAISVENGCAYGRISNIDFYNTNKYPNQDGVDIRKGCHDIIIENITGITGDDIVALTGLRGVNEKSRSTSMEVGGREPGENDDIYNITINTVMAKCVGGHAMVRLLNQDGIKLYNIFISNIIDTSIEGEIFPRAARNRHAAAIRIGEDRYWTIRPNELGETYNIFIDNVVSRAITVVLINGTLKNSVLKNIVGYAGTTDVIKFGNRPVENLTINSIHY